MPKETDKKELEKIYKAAISIINDAASNGVKTSQVELSKVIGVSKSMMSMMMSGERSWSLAQLNKLREHFGQKRIDVTKEHQQRNINSIYVNELDVTAHGGCGALEGAINEVSVGEWSIPSQYVRGHIDTSRAQLSIITVIGDSMEPDFPNGCRVMVNTADKSPTPAGHFVVWDGNGLVMKLVEYIPHSSPARVRISSINKKYSPYEVELGEAHINGRVIGMWKWV